MKFALLGVDEEALSLARYLVAHSAHEFVAAYEAAAKEPALASIAPQATFGQAWEALLHEPLAEAVIVASGPPEERSEQLTRLAKSGMPLLVVWPTCDVVTAYELEMIRRDTQAPLMAFIPGLLHPAVQRLRQTLALGGDSPIGTIEQVACERRISDRSREAVLRQLTRDVALMRLVAGEVHKVGAMGPAANAPQWSNLSVQMSGPGSILLRWSMQPSTDESGGRLVVYGSQGHIALEMPATRRAWKLNGPVSGEAPDGYENWNEPQAVIERFLRLEQDSGAESAWPDACRAVEIADTVERSLARGKTIELYDEEVSEEATFKGMMAVGGCGLLLLALLGLIGAAAVEGLQLPFRQHVLWRMWPIYLLGPFLLFLLLQFFRLVFRQGPTPTGDRRSKAPPGDSR